MANPLVSSVVVFSVLGLSLTLLERRARALAPPRITLRTRVTNTLHWLLGPLLNRVATRALLTLAVLGLTVLSLGRLPRLWGRFLPLTHDPLAALPRPLQLLVALFIADLTSYAAHRVMHGRRLWRLHAIHHSAAQLNWFSAARNHPLGDALSNALSAAVLLPLGFPTAIVSLVAPLLLLHAVLLHADVRWTFGPLRYVIASPAFHRWHHSSEVLDRNFAGLFPVIDVVFGTFYMPRGEQPTRFGVVGEPVPEGYLAQLWYPFRRARPTTSP
jgi:sterol desaturase/sphingolipid hydroxylase (fatty acid hydroxylase superfamily)